MRGLLATVGFLAAAILILSSAVPTLAKASHSVSLDLRGCFLICLLTDRGADLFSPARIPTEVTIDRYPEAWRKRDDLEVAGRVRTPEGAGVAGMTVEIFLNRTKSTPGQWVGRAVSDDAGWWLFRGPAPADLRAGDYQLVARAQERRWFGTVHLEGWSDPEVSMWSGTRLEAQPRWETQGWRVRVHLVDDTGAPVPQGTLRWEEGGRRVGISRTDPDGAAEEVFSGPGPRTLQIRFDGLPDYEPSQVLVALPAPTLQLDASVLGALPGESATLRGRTDPGLTVEVEGRQVSADATGRFEVPLAPRAEEGRYPILVTAGGRNATAELHVGRPMDLRLETGRGWWFGATAQVKVTSEGQPLAGARVRLTSAGEETVARTGPDGTVRARLPVPRGQWEVEVEATADGHVARTATGSAPSRGLADLALLPAALAAASASMRLGPYLAPALRIRARLRLEGPDRAVAGEPLEFTVLSDPPGPVVVEAELTAPGEPPRVVRLGTQADPRGQVRVRPDARGRLALRARRLPSATCRGGEVRHVLAVDSYADALERAGRVDLAVPARWDRPPARREAWERGGRPA